MRLTATAAALLAGLALLAGCQSTDEPTAAPSANTTVGPAATTSTEASPQPSAATTTAAGCAMTGTVTGGDGPALQFMKAWLTCDTTKQKKLTSDAAYTQVTKIGVPKLDMTWTNASCEGAAGATYCTYRNKLGSDLIIRSRNDATDHAITEVRLDATVYYTDAEKYAREYLDAFVNHNKPRMIALSSQSVVDSVVADAPPAGYTLTLTGEPHWVYSAQFTTTGEYWIVTIHNPLGKAHAVTAFGNAG
ncbi:MAG: hypothetical protein HOV77_18920 [Hamadaea sp.]|uniref:hypothetical protein n=1 Tax=Hamadaea sp. TaxID=2024425 RepID=UPI001794E535|nr:hypothetical protein [Hamadaea sp.]NUT21249.1 hypothetical protein [Hamadaea sp.]